MSKDLLELRKALHHKAGIKKMHLDQIVFADDVTVDDRFIIPLAVIKNKQLTIIACKNKDINPGWVNVKTVSAFEIKSMSQSISGSKEKPHITRSNHNDFNSFQGRGGFNSQHNRGRW